MPSFLFTDVEGSTQLVRDQESDWAAIIDRQREIIAVASEARGGRLVTTAGDGCFFAFADDDGRAAVTAAVEAQRVLLDETWPGGADIRVRMGVHAGPATPVGDDWVGLAVHQAARLGTVGHGGQIIVAADVCPRELEVVSLGRHVVKDFDDELELVQLTAPGWRAPFPPLRTMSRSRNNLPLRRTTFVGRERERAIVDKLVDESRLVTIVGPGGVGKTRLAVESAGERIERHAHGAFLVELTPVTPGGVASAIAAAIAEPGVQAADRRPVTEQLADRAVLLVLDNCEHLLDEAASVVDRILDRCAEVHVIATSREQLGVPGEAVCRLTSLAVPEGEGPGAEDVLDHAATRLLLDRAQLVRHDLVLDAGAAAAMTRVCRRLDGLPLAIELAAARLGTLTLDELEGWLAERYDVLDGVRRSGAPHQRTLDDLIGWSYDLLDDEERTVLRRLSVFAGHCGADAAAAVCAAESGFDDLVAQSLVQADSVEGATRYRLLETVRAHARRRLVEAGEEDATERAHAEWFAHLVRDQMIRFAGPEQSDAMRTLAMELDEIRRALRSMIDHGWGERASLTAGNLRSYWLAAGLVEEGRRWLGEVLAVPQEAETRGRARALQAAGWMAVDQQDLEAAEPLLREGVVVAEAVGDDRCRAQGLDALARVAMARGDVTAAEQLLEESLAVRRRENIPVEVSAALNNLAGVVAEYDPERAARLLEEGLDIDRAALSPTAIAISLRNVGILRWPSADAARTAWTEALELARQASDRRLEILLLHDLSRCAEAEGEHTAAADLLDEALTLAASMQAARRLPSLHLDRARVARLVGDRSLAVRHAEAARDLAIQVGEAAVVADAEDELGRATAVG